MTRPGLDRSCPRCAAPVGTRCRTLLSGRVTDIHMARITRAEPAVDYTWATDPRPGEALDRALDSATLYSPEPGHADPRVCPTCGSWYDPEGRCACEPEPDSPVDALGWYMAQAEADLKAVTEEAPDALDALADLQDTSVLDLIAWCQTRRRELVELERTVTLYAGQNLRVPRSGTMADGRTFQVLRGKDRKGWDHEAWQRDARHAVIRESVPESLGVIDMNTGDMVETARHLAQRVSAGVQAVHGSGPPRTTALKRLGIDPDEYAETTPGAWTVQFQDPTTPTTED